eukprot:gene1433-2780_t
MAEYWIDTTGMAPGLGWLFGGPTAFLHVLAFVSSSRTLDAVACAWSDGLMHVLYHGMLGWFWDMLWVQVLPLFFRLKMDLVIRWLLSAASSYTSGLHLQCIPCTSLQSIPSMSTSLASCIHLSKLSAHDAQYLLAACPGATALTFHRSVYDPLEQLSVHRFEQLNTLELVRCRLPTAMDNSWHASLCRTCPGLRHLRIHLCTAPPGPGNGRTHTTWDPAENPPAIQFSELQHIDLDSLGDQELVSMASYCPGLKHADLRGSMRITDKTLTQIGRSCPHLCMLGLSSRRISSVGLVTLVRGCSALTRLALTSMTQAFGSHCPSLESVDLTRCLQITDLGVDALSKGSPGLTSVSFSLCKRVTDEGIISLAEHCRRLTKLDLRHCDGLASRGLTALGSHCNRLTALDCCGCMGIANLGAAAVIMGCPELAKLDIAFSQLSRGGLFRALRGGSRPALRCLGLSYCTRLNDADMELLGKLCPGLTRLDLSGCTPISHHGVRTLGHSLPDLRHLNLCHTWIKQFGLPKGRPTPSEPPPTLGGVPRLPANCQVFCTNFAAVDVDRCF